MKSFMDWSCSVVPRKIRKISSMNLFQNGMAQIKASRMVSSWRPMKRLAYGGAALVPMAVPTSWRKCLSMNERLLFFRMVSISIPIVWGSGHLGVGCWHVTSCSVAQILCPLHVVCSCRVM